MTLSFLVKHLENSTPERERHSRQRNINNYVVKSEDGTDEKDVKTSQGEKKLENCQLCNRHHNLDEYKAFNDMVVAERRKVLVKQKLCYGCYESISAKHTAHNSPKRRTCKICFGKHPTGLHGFQYKKKDGKTKGNSQHQQKSVKRNYGNVDGIHCESIGTEDVLSMCVIQVKVQHNQSDQETITFSMLAVKRHLSHRVLWSS